MTPPGRMTPDTPALSTSPLAPQRVDLPRHWLVWAVALMVLGGVVQMLPLNRDGILWMHQVRLLPDTVWALATLLAAGWSVLILLCLSDRGSEGGRAVLLAFLLGGLLSHGLKVMFEVPRPGLVTLGTVE